MEELRPDMITGPLTEEEEAFCFHAENSLRKKFRKTIWSRFTLALKQYRLVNAGDRVAVCISGGKDSTLMAKLFQELKRYSRDLGAAGKDNYYGWGVPVIGSLYSLVLIEPIIGRPLIFMEPSVTSP